MIRKRKILAGMLALALSLGMITVSAMAAKDDDVEKVRSIRITPRSVTVGVDKGIQLDYRITPSDADEDFDVTWSSNNPDVADVDDNGYVTGNSPGTTTIKIRTTSGKTDTVTVKVPGRNPTLESETDKRDATPSTDEDATSIDASPIVTANNGTVSETSPDLTTRTEYASDTSPTTVTQAILSDAVSKATGGNATITGGQIVSTDTLRSVAQTAKDNKVKVNFDTVSGGKVGRITIDPAAVGNLNGTYGVAVYTAGESVERVQSVFDTHFSNDAAVVRFYHATSFVIPVEVAVKPSLTNTGNLKFYQYDVDTSKYYQLENTEYRVDSNGYVHFTTTQGGYVVISQGDLTRK